MRQVCIRMMLPLLLGLLLSAAVEAQERPQRYIPQRYEDFVSIDVEASSRQAPATTTTTTTTTAATTSTTTTTQAPTSPPSIPEQATNTQTENSFRIGDLPPVGPQVVPAQTPDFPPETQPEPQPEPEPSIPLDNQPSGPWPGYDGTNQLVPPSPRPTWTQSPPSQCPPYCGPHPVIYSWHGQWEPGHRNPFGPGYVRHHKYLRVSVGRYISPYRN